MLSASRLLSVSLLALENILYWSPLPAMRRFKVSTLRHSTRYYAADMECFRVESEAILKARRGKIVADFALVSNDTRLMRARYTFISRERFR